MFPAFLPSRRERIVKAMDEVKQFREFLGPAADGYNDAQLAQLRREMQAMAELLLDIYLYKKSQNDRPTDDSDSL